MDQGGAVYLTIAKGCTKTEALHPLDYVGIDTCSAMSVSTEIGDFLFLDQSKEAVHSVELNGVGGGESKVGGRGLMLIKAIDTNGKEVFVVDPAGVYLVSSDSQARLRILGQQRMKAFGLYLQQNKFGDGEDYLVFMHSRMFNLATKRGILLLKTLQIEQHEREDSKLNKLIDKMVLFREQDCCFTYDGETSEYVKDTGIAVVNTSSRRRREGVQAHQYTQRHRHSVEYE